MGFGVGSAPALAPRPFFRFLDAGFLFGVVDFQPRPRPLPFKPPGWPTRADDNSVSNAACSDLPLFLLRFWLGAFFRRRLVVGGRISSSCVAELSEAGSTLHKLRSESQNDMNQYNSSIF